VEPVLDSVQTPEGDAVVLAAAAWSHIADEHPEIAPYRGKVLATIAEPNAVTDDPRPGRQRFYRRGIGPSRWLRVIVDFNQSPARIVTAFGFRKEYPA
jgi:glycine/D-amino acid oxidase-like deaminating enzyme